MYLFVHVDLNLVTESTGGRGKKAVVNLHQSVFVFMRRRLGVIDNVFFLSIVSPLKHTTQHHPNCKHGMWVTKITN